MGDLGEGGRVRDRSGLGFSQFTNKRESNGTENGNLDYIVPEILWTIPTVQVPKNHILTQNLYYNITITRNTSIYLNIGHLDPLGYVMSKPEYLPTAFLVFLLKL